MIDITINRNPYLHELHLVSYYDRDTGESLVKLQNPGDILKSIRARQAEQPVLVFFISGGRQTRMYAKTREENTNDGGSR